MRTSFAWPSLCRRQRSHDEGGRDGPYPNDALHEISISEAATHRTYEDAGGMIVATMVAPTAPRWSSRLTLLKLGIVEAILDVTSPQRVVRAEF